MPRKDTETQPVLSRRARVEAQTEIRRQLLANGYVPLANGYLDASKGVAFPCPALIKARSQPPNPAYRKEDFWCVTTSKGHEVLFDEIDLDIVLPRRWYSSVRKRLIYVATNRHRHESGPSAFYLHRLILRPPEGFVVDHIDGNGLDNRRRNLRVATHAQNAWNGRKHVDNTSGYRGVYWAVHMNKWESKIVLGGERVHLGYFDCARAAAEAYTRESEARCGAFASHHRGA